MGWEDSLLPAALDYIEGKPIPEGLLFEERQPKMSANHDAGRICLLACAGRPEQLYGWLVCQYREHQGPEQLSTVYSSHYETYLAAATIAYERYGYESRYSFDRHWTIDWWDHHLALYRLLADPEMTTVVTPGSRCNRPHEYSQGGVLRLLAGKPTKRDLQVARRDREPVLWAVKRMLEVTGWKLRGESPPLLKYPLMVWRGEDFHFAWAPYLESPRAYPQHAVYWRYKDKADFGDPLSRNPMYIRGPSKGSRHPTPATTYPHDVWPSLEGELRNAKLYAIGTAWSNLEPVKIKEQS